MTRSVVIPLLVTVVFEVAHAAAASSVDQTATATPQRGQPKLVATSTVRGRVTTAEGGPLRRAQVRASSPELREPKFTTTDLQGRYELKDLPAGRYTLTASKTGYVTLQYGQKRPFESGTQVQLAVGEMLDRLDFTLPRGAVLAGRVVDEFGDPVASAIVRPLRYRYIRGRRRLINAGAPGQMVQSNDLGEFRVFGLPPGQYYLSAIVRNIYGGETEDRAAYAPTYYPNTNNAAEAQRLTVGVGQQLGDLTIALSPVRTAQVAGTATDADGRPLAGHTVVLYQRSVAAVGGSATVNPDGTFVISNVPPGEYTVTAETDNGGGDPRETAMTPVTVAGGDVNGIRLSGQQPAALSGRVTAEGEGTPSLPAGLRVIVEASRFDEDWFGPNTTRIREDGSFEVAVRPGHVLVRVDGLPRRWALKHVAVNGTDVTDGELTVAAGEQVAAIEVIVTNRISELSGDVVDEARHPTKDFSVVVFARDPDRWNSGSRYIEVVRPDQDGRFTIEGLPAGDYYAAAVTYIEQGGQYDADYLNRLQSHAVRFALADGEHRTIELMRTSIE